MSNKPPSGRQLKVSENLKRIIATEFSINRIYADIVGNMNITVSEVRLSPDLKNARIYIIPDCAEEDLDQVIKLINEFSFEIKKSIAAKASLKYVPNLKFFYDDVFKQADNIENILAHLDE